MYICCFGITSRSFLTSADNDYKATASTLVFEPSDEVILQQCLEIEIINDSLPEDWEVFTLLLSTNNSAVDLVTHRVNVYINDGKYLHVTTECHTLYCVGYLIENFRCICKTYYQKSGRHLWHSTPKSLSYSVMKCPKTPKCCSHRCTPDM